MLAALKKFHFKVLDITGGEPAMHPHLKYLIEQGRNYVDTIIVRTNLVILKEEGYEDYIDFYIKNKVQLVASLPCYTKENTDTIRGEGTFSACIAVIKELNEAGYGVDKSLELNFVYNPGGAFLPGCQGELEKDYKKVLGESYGLKFNHLFTITNIPIGRFAQDLKTKNLMEEYVKLLEENYNEEAARNIMCRSQISVGYDGKLYDCGQVVVSHFSDEFGISKELARKISATFGAGTFKSETCGAVLGAYVVIGLRYGHCQEGDGEKKSSTIEKIKEFDEKFKALHKSEVCREMLGYDLSKAEDNKIIMERGLLFSYCPNAVQNAIEILENL